tara:strand:+ start:92 stop:1450 length:1359 start_codon:yes stop_codon:yes gene_type:complete
MTQRTWKLSEIGIRTTGLPSDLRVKQPSKSPYFIAEFLPDKDLDPRPNQGRNKSGKRLCWQSSSLKTSDLFEAGKRAVEWWKNLQKKEEKEYFPVQKQYSLNRYWESWFTRESDRPRRNRIRWRRDTALKWEAPLYGIVHQPFAKKNVEEIRYGDFVEYFALLDKRASAKNDMGGTKKQQKTLIRTLLKEARSNDFPKLSIPDFPEIKHQKKEATYLTGDEWKLLMEKVVELSKSVCGKELSNKEYQLLEWTKRDRRNQRNWVDLYDALAIMWSFHLRAEDLPRLKSEWFTEVGGVINLRLEETKGNRKITNTSHIRDNIVGTFLRIRKRKPKGYLILPHLPRQEGNEADSHVKETLNDLLKYAVDLCRPKVSSRGITFTSIRHTAFHQVLKEFPDLRQRGQIDLLADYGRTSVKMLQEVYLDRIEREETLRNLRGKFDPQSWYLHKGRIKI